MLNQVIFIGRLTKDPELVILDDGKKVADIRLAIQRPFKNHEGLYETDFVNVSLWQGLAESLNQFCEKGSLIALRGRVQTKKVTIEDRSFTSLEIIGERVTYLSSSKKATTSIEA